MFCQLLSFSVAMSLILLGVPVTSVPVSEHQEVLDDFGTYPATYAPSDTYQAEVYEYVTASQPGLSTIASSGVATLSPSTTTMSLESTTPVSGCVCPPVSESSEASVAPGVVTSTLPPTAVDGSEEASSVTTTAASFASTESQLVTATTAAASGAELTSTTQAMPSETMMTATVAPLSKESDVRVVARVPSQRALCSCPKNGTVLMEVNAGGGEISANEWQEVEITDTSAAKSETLNQFWMPADIDIVNNAEMDLALEGKGYFLRSHVSGKSFQYFLSGFVPRTTYTLRLGFAETWQATCDFGADSRVFDVNVNGVLALGALDVYSETQACNFGLVKEIPIMASGEGAIVVDFYALFGEAFVSAVQVLAKSSVQNETGIDTRPSVAPSATAQVATTMVSEMSTPKST